jgi:uncharacterized 2Fe-2S/4Fe-4S cluster protein (DUF4445 family)
MSEPDALVVFTPSGKRGRFALGTPLLQAARSLGVDVDSVCGGRALCGRCQVLVMEGDFPKHAVTSSANHLSALSAAEQSFARRRPLPAGHRLSCQAQIEGNLVVDVPPGSQVHRQVVRRRPTLTRSRSIRWRACTTWRCASRTCTILPVILSVW